MFYIVQDGWKHLLQFFWWGGEKGQKQQKIEQLCCINMSRSVHAAWKQMMQA